MKTLKQLHQEKRIRVNRQWNHKCCLVPNCFFSGTTLSNDGTRVIDDVFGTDFTVRVRKRLPLANLLRHYNLGPNNVFETLASQHPNTPTLGAWGWLGCLGPWGAGGLRSWEAWGTGGAWGWGALTYIVFIIITSYVGGTDVSVSTAAICRLTLVLTLLLT